MWITCHEPLDEHWRFRKACIRWLRVAQRNISAGHPGQMCIRDRAQALYGSVRAAAALAKARCELDLAALVAVPAPTCTAAAGTVNMDGTAVTMVNRYPAATAAGIVAAAQIVAANDGVVIAGAAPLTITMNGATAAANCRISYTAAPLNGSPNIVLDATNC